MARLELLDLDEVDGYDPAAPAGGNGRLAQAPPAVVTAMNTLPERLLQILALYAQEGCTLRQIGSVLGIGESRVSQLHTEAIHKAARGATGRE